MEHLVPRGRYRQRLIAVDGQYTRSTHAHPDRHDRTNRLDSDPLPRAPYNSRYGPERDCQIRSWNVD